MPTIKDIGVITDVDLTRKLIVRRYLDLPKYLDLLRSRTIYFQRADRFSDRFEGALTPAIRESLDDTYRKGLMAYDAAFYYRRSRMGSYISCWSLGAKDNMALWQLYGGLTTSVAVTSTIGKLVTVSARWPDKVFIHKVQYIDHFKSPAMVLGRYTDLLRFKHEAYKYESEVRLIVSRQHDQWETNPEGIRLPVKNLNTLIRSIVVAPEAGAWFYDLIKDVTRKYGITSPVRRSKLTYLPK